MTVLAGQAAATALPLWVTSLLIPVAVAALAGGLVTHFLQRSDAKRARRREGYAEAVAALAAWAEYPYRIRRRTSDRPDELARLVAIGHDLQERLARAQAWIAADDPSALTAYQDSLRDLKADAAPYISEAWSSSPITSPAELTLGAWGPLGAAQVIEALAMELGDKLQ